MSRQPRFLDRRLKLRQLRFVESLERSRSLAKAARELGLTQPALSKALHELEDAVGEPLFERHAQGVTPTAAGEVLIRFASQVLSDVSRLDDDLDQLAKPGGGLVVIGALPVAAAGLLPPPIVRDLRARHPDLEVRLEEGRVETLLPRLAAGELDIVLGRLYPPDLPDGLRRETLYEEPIALLARCGHPAFASPANPSPDLSRWGLILPTFSQRIGREIEHFLAARKLELPSHTIRSTSHLFIREMLHESDMVTVSPQLLMAGGLRRGSLRILPVMTRSPSRPAGMILNPLRPPSASLRLAIANIRSTIADLIATAGSGITDAYGSFGGSDDDGGPIDR